jgi:hypothetical protein
VIDDLERGILFECLHERPAPPFEEALNRPARDSHAFCRLNLAPSFTVAQPHRLELIEPDSVDGELMHGNPGRLVEPAAACKAAAAVLAPARHPYIP